MKEDIIRYGAQLLFTSQHVAVEAELSQLRHQRDAVRNGAYESMKEINGQIQRESQSLCFVDKIIKEAISGRQNLQKPVREREGSLRWGQ